MPATPNNVPEPSRTDPALIRNFCIIAHIDHGKSTLADRMLQLTGVVEQRQMRAQYLDRMDIERERGITIKSQAVRLPWAPTHDPGSTHILNMIDTPGHVDFTYEVSRSLAACQGALLVVDASQGVEAQTLANAHLAVDAGLEIVPVINKIDLPGAEPDKAREQIENVIGIDASEAILASAKMGVGIDEILEAIVHRMPPPAGDPSATLRGLVFDSWFDQYRGVVVLVHVVDGKLEPKMKVRLMASGGTYEVEQLVDLAGHSLRLGAGQVDLVHRRDQLEAGVHGQVGVGERLRLHALRRVDHEQRAVARGQRARHLVGEVHVPGRVDQVQLVGLAVLGLVEDAHGLSLDRDAALALELHRVEHLGTHRARVDGVRQLQDAVGQRRLPMIDMGDDREVPDMRLVGHDA